DGPVDQLQVGGEGEDLDASLPVAIIERFDEDMEHPVAFEAERVRQKREWPVWLRQPVNRQAVIDFAPRQNLIERRADNARPPDIHQARARADLRNSSARRIVAQAAWITA